jgi:hypothetical protein
VLAQRVADRALDAFSRGRHELTAHDLEDHPDREPVAERRLEDAVVEVSNAPHEQLVHSP